jgi:ATP-binding cassette subfamily C (CFTR/MRP) protein 1
MMLSGTVRSQIDLSGATSYSEIKSALQKVHVWAAIESRGGLDAILLDQPLSHGEQQLVCLARALLRRSKVVILDEATSSLDKDTDVVVQALLREAFAGCTVISVAYRVRTAFAYHQKWSVADIGSQLDTILSSDKIAVLDGGRLVGFDCPKRLLATHSHFRKLYQSK